MFCPPDYVSLAELWKEFLGKRRARMSAIARKKYCVEVDMLVDEFGSPMDFCEDVFLTTFGDMSVFAADKDGKVDRLETVLDGGRSQLFVKMSVLESALAARDPQEAGPDNFWLHKMGSGAFEAWTDIVSGPVAWRHKYPASGGLTESPGQEVFHTLPIAFERARFIIPDMPPPWVIDVIDEHFLPKVIQAFGGCALCLSAEQAKRWRAKYIAKSGFLTHLELSADPVAQIGRPGKQSRALDYYRQLYPTGQHGTLKSACQEIERQFGFFVAAKTLERAIKGLRFGGTKPQTK